MDAVSSPPSRKFNKMRKIETKRIKKILKPVYFFLNRSLLFFRDFSKRKIKKYIRIFYHQKFKNSYSFAILCVKNRAYIDLAIKNINSLHYFNPTHKFVINCDDICYNHLFTKKSSFDYPRNVDIINHYGNQNRPWQMFKIDTLISASNHGKILIDADEIWHSDFEIDPQKITFQAYAYKLKEQEPERLFVSTLLCRPEWGEFGHYVTGFLKIPKELMSEKIAQELIELTDKILTNNLDFLSDVQKNGIKRLSEELAVNVVIQDNFTANKIAVLKEKESKGDKNILQSLYYGCANNILE